MKRGSAQRKMLEEAARLVELEQLQVKVSEILPLEQVAKAHQLIEAGHTTGKIVLTLD
jgi:NADPH2:quinone reductase